MAILHLKFTNINSRTKHNDPFRSH